MMLAAASSVAGLLLGFGGGCEIETRDTDIKLISVGQVKTLVDRQNQGRQGQILLIDPRPTKYFEAGHIAGARNLLLPQVDPKNDRDPSLMGSGIIVVYGDDPASASARGMTKRLMAVGYKGVRLFAGGLKEWRGRGYAVEGAPPPPSPAAVEPTPAPDAGQTPRPSEP